MLPADAAVSGVEAATRSGGALPEQLVSSPSRDVQRICRTVPARAGSAAVTFCCPLLHHRLGADVTRATRRRRTAIAAGTILILTAIVGSGSPSREEPPSTSAA